MVSTKDASPRRARGWRAIAAAAAVVTAACGNPVSPDAGAPASVPTGANASGVSGAADETCSFSLSTTRQRFDRTGGEGSLTIQAPAGCSWTVAADAPWVTITGGTNMAGNGFGTITYRVAAAAEDRTATLTAAGQAVAIVQGTPDAPPPTPTAAPCSISAAARPATFPANGGSGTLDVTSTCPWVATAASWIDDVTRGNGTASVAFSVSATTVARDAMIVISPATGFSGSSASVRVTQAAPVPTPTPTPTPVPPVAAPSLTRISPTRGDVKGGTAVTISGTNLLSVTSVRFGGAAAASLTVANDTTVSAVTPPHASGVVDVQVSGPTGSATLAQAFTYEIVEPTACVAPRVNPTTVSIPYNSEGTFMDISSSCSWIAVINVDWLAFVSSKQLTGAGNARVFIQTLGGPNSSAAARTATVSVGTSASRIDATLTIRQDGAPLPTASIVAAVAQNPVPFSGKPITDAVCVGNPNTWFYDETLTETVGVGVRITQIIDVFDGVVRNDTLVDNTVSPRGRVTYRYQWCWSPLAAHRVQSTFSGVDANGHPISVVGPEITLLAKPGVAVSVSPAGSAAGGGGALRK